MSAFLIASITVKNMDKFSEYAKQTAATYEPFGGEVVLKGKVSGVLTDGDSDHNMVGILTFPDMSALDEWYISDAYQALVPLRDQGADVIFVKYEQPK